MRTSKVVLEAEYEDNASDNFERSFRGMRGDISSTEKTVARMEKSFVSLKRVVIGAFSIEVARRLAAFELDIVKLNDQVNIASSSFERLARKAGTDATTELAKLSKATQGTISDLELMQRVGAAVDAGLTFEQARTAMQFLRAYSLAFGKDFNQLVQTIFTGLQRGSVLFLDDAGIILSATDKMFAGLGDLEKKTALVNEAVRLMGEKLKNLEVPANSASLEIDRVAVAWTNLKIALGDQDSAAGGLRLVTDLLSAAEGNVRAFWELNRQMNLMDISAKNFLGIELNERQRRIEEQHSPQMSEPMGLTPERPRRYETQRRYRTGMLPGITVHPGREEEERTPLGGGMPSRNLDVEVTIGRKKRELELQAIQDLDARAQAELRRAQAAESAQLLMDGANDLQLKALGKLHLQERQRLTTEQEIIIAQAEVNKRRQQELQVVDGLVGVMSRLQPQLQGFFSAASNLARGDMIGAGVSAVHGVLDVFGVARDPIDRFADQIRSVAEAARETNRSVHGLLEEYSGTSAEIKALQENTFEPLRRSMELLQEGSKEQSHTEFLLSFFEMLRLAEGSATQSGKIIPKFQQALDESGLHIDQFRDMIDLAFGKDSTIVDAAKRMFEVADAANTAAEAMLPLERALRSEFFVRETQLREQASIQARAAGADPLAQRRIFMELSKRIEDSRRTEEVRRRHLSGTATTSAAKPAITTGGGTSGTSDPFQLNLTPTQKPWHETVEMYVDEAGRHEPTHWSNLVDIPVGLKEYERRWWQTLEMVEDLRYRHRPTHWSNLAYIPHDLTKFRRHWSDTVDMYFDANRHEPRHWGNLAYIPHDLAKFRRHWSDVIELDLTPIWLDPSQLIRLTANRTRLPITSLIDFGSLQSAVLGIVSRAQRDRQSASSERRRLMEAQHVSRGYQPL